MSVPERNPADASSAEAGRKGHVIAGKYRLLELLGKGGRGEVYRALQLDLDRTVALKLQLDLDEPARERFVAEAIVTAGLRHPGVAEVFDAGVDEDGTPYYAMELLEGESLAERLARVGRIPAEELVPIAAGICSALNAAHAKGFLHRDVTPGNIFLALRPDGGMDPKLIDFGIAKELGALPEEARQVTLRGLGRRPQHRTLADVIVGTPLYLSPEQILGDELDARADVYSLAVTLYEALAGAPPFEAPTIARLLHHIVCDPPEPLGERAPEAGVPAALDREILRALAKAPGDRHPGAAELAAALWGALAEARGSAPRLAGRASSRARLWVAGLGAVVLLLITFVVARAPHGVEPVASAIAAPTVEPAVVAPSVEPGPPAPPALPDAIPIASPRAAPSARRRAAVDAAHAASPSAASAAPIAASAPPPDYRIDDLKSPF